MMQGDSYNLAIRIDNNAGNPVTPGDVIDVEITIGDICKTYRNGQLNYSNGLWLFPINQRETFGANPGAPKSQVRVKWADGTVEGKALNGVRIEESLSREVL